MEFSEREEFEHIRMAVRKLCDGFPSDYWRSLEPDQYPLRIVDALTRHGWLAALIPEEYGGGGLDLTGVCVILEEISASELTQLHVTRKCM